MKKFLSVLLVAQLFSAQTFASVASDVELLGKLAMGTNVQSIKGKNAESIFMNWLEKEYGEDEDRKLVFKEIEDMAYGDEVDEGFTSTRSALKMNEFAIGALTESVDDLENEDDKEPEIKELKVKVFDLQHKWSPIIKRLERQGVKFGYTGNGPGYCGVSFVEMIIVDPKEQKVYEVYLSTSGEC